MCHFVVSSTCFWLECLHIADGTGTEEPVAYLQSRVRSLRDIYRISAGYLSLLVGCLVPLCWMHCSSGLLSAGYLSTYLDHPLVLISFLLSGAPLKGLRSLIILVSWEVWKYLGKFGRNAMLVSWEVWKERNAKVFQRKFQSLQQILSKIKEEARCWILAGSKHLGAICQLGEWSLFRSILHTTVHIGLDLVTLSFIN